MNAYEDKEALIDAFAAKLIAQGSYKGDQILGDWDAISTANYLVSYIGDRPQHHSALDVPADAKWIIGGNSEFGYAV